MANSYIPSADGACRTWAVNFAALITANPTLYGLTGANATAIQTPVDTFDADLTAALDPSTRTSVTVATKDASKAIMLNTVRFFAQQVRNNPSVTNGNKTALGITIPKLTPTPIPAPTVPPEIGFRSSIVGVATMQYSVAGELGKAKPVGSIGTQIFAHIGDAPISDPAEASFVNTVTRSPFTLATSPADAGKVVTVFARFNTRGGTNGEAQVGPFSGPLSFIAM